jgi:hypothetical protein
MSNVPRSNHAARALILAILGIAGAALADSAPDYRLAGIVAVGQDHLLAVIEMPDGKQGLFRAGDALGSGRIRDITRSDVRVEMNGQDLLLSLRGNPKLSAAVPAAEAPEEEDTIAQAPTEDVTTRKQPLFYGDTMRLLNSARGGAAADKQAAGAPATANGAPVATGEQLSTRMNELLGVPAGARIVAVDGSAASSPQDVIDKVVPLLGSGRAVRLDVTGAGDLQTIYITPVEEDISTP